MCKNSRHKQIMWPVISSCSSSVRNTLWTLCMHRQPLLAPVVLVSKAASREGQSRSGSSRWGTWRHRHSGHIQAASWKRRQTYSFGTVLRFRFSTHVITFTIKTTMARIPNTIQCGQHIKKQPKKQPTKTTNWPTLMVTHMKLSTKGVWLIYRWRDHKTGLNPLSLLYMQHIYHTPALNIQENKKYKSTSSAFRKVAEACMCQFRWLHTGIWEMVSMRERERESESEQAYCHLMQPSHQATHQCQDIVTVPFVPVVGE